MVLVFHGHCQSHTPLGIGDPSTVDLPQDWRSLHMLPPLVLMAGMFYIGQIGTTMPAKDCLRLNKTIPQRTGRPWESSTM